MEYRVVCLSCDDVVDLVVVVAVVVRAVVVVPFAWVKAFASLGFDTRHLMNIRPRHSIKVVYDP